MERADRRPTLLRAGAPTDREGPPVLLLHSGGLSARQWRGLAAELANDHQVFAPDFLGYGAEPWPAEEEFHRTLDLLATVRLLEEIGRPTIVVGHSYGGAIGLHAALLRPDLVLRVAAYEPPLFGVLPADARPALDGPEAAAIRAARGPARDALLAAWIDAFLAYWNPGAPVPAAAKAPFLARAWKLFGEVQSLSADTTPATVWRALTPPAFFLSGAASPPSAQAVVRALAAATGGVLRSFPEVGHMGPITHGAIVNPALRAFIAGEVLDGDDASG